MSECARAGNPGNQKSNQSGGEMCGLLERPDPASALGPAPECVGEKLPEKASVAQVLVDQPPQPAGVGLLFLTQGAGKIAPLLAWQMLQMLDQDVSDGLPDHLPLLMVQHFSDRGVSLEKVRGVFGCDDPARRRPARRKVGADDRLDETVV